VASLKVTHFTDPGCPWAYSARPAHAVLRWRYGAALEWRHVWIGLTEEAAQYEARGYTPAGSAQGYLAFRRRYGMPFATQPRPRLCATGRACRALVAVRLTDAAREEEAFRALQHAWFTTPLVLDEDPAIAQALEHVPGLDVPSVLEVLAEPEVERLYQADRAEARTAAASPSERQGKTARTDGPVRYTAPSLVFTEGARRLEAGGFQPVEAYDVLIANLDPVIDRRPPPDDVVDALRAFPYALTTQEVAAILTRGNDAPDRDGAEARLIEAVGAGDAVREPLGDDALWTAA
jgi:predicted DsbA family dithiol-disulfide isomerase